MIDSSLRFYYQHMKKIQNKNSLYFLLHYYLITIFSEQILMK